MQVADEITKQKEYEDEWQQTTDEERTLDWGSLNSEKITIYG